MKKVLLPLLAVAIVGVVGCQKEGCTDSTATNYDEDAKKDDGSCLYDDHDHVNITFDEPTDGQVIALADADDVHLHIEFEFEGEAHGFEVTLENETTGAAVDDWEVHSHEANQTFMQEVDLSGFDPGDEFHLEAKAFTNHDETEFETAEIHFELGQ